MATKTKTTEFVMAPTLALTEAKAWSKFKREYREYLRKLGTDEKPKSMSQLTEDKAYNTLKYLVNASDLGTANKGPKGELILTDELLILTMNREFGATSAKDCLKEIEKLKMRSDDFQALAWYVGRVEELLKEATEQIPNKALVAQILRAIEAVNPATAKFLKDLGIAKPKELIKAAVDEYKRLEKMAKELEGRQAASLKRDEKRPPKANSHGNNNNNNNHNNQKRAVAVGTCWGCGKEGHKQRDCTAEKRPSVKRAREEDEGAAAEGGQQPQPETQTQVAKKARLETSTTKTQPAGVRQPSEKKTTTVPITQVKCFNCQRLGHYATNCPLPDVRNVKKT
jgi:hypothetical protein